MVVLLESFKRTSNSTASLKVNSIKGLTFGKLFPSIKTQGKTMNSNKKAYFAPELVVHGSVETITQSGGPSQRTDVPNGTVPGANGINDITS